MTAVRRLKALDAFPKIQDDFYSQTFSGGAITLVCGTLMCFLFLTELGRYIATQTVHKLEVDTSRGERIALQVDITFPRIPCSWLSVDAMDVSGRIQLDVDHDLFRQRLTLRGKPFESRIDKHEVGPSKDDVPDHLLPEKSAALPEGYCGSCYGADAGEGQCCNTCDDVRKAYSIKGWIVPDYDKIEQCKREGFQDSITSTQNEGCRLWGQIDVAKVAGSIQFAPGKTYQRHGQLVHDLQPFRNVKLDVSHRISLLSFGPAYPGQRNPLANVEVDQRRPEKDRPAHSPGMHQYYLKVVPTSYTTTAGHTTQSNEYSVTEHFRAVEAGAALGGPPPGVYMYYDLSAIKVNVVEQKRSFLHFLTNVCAIVGGIFTVAGLVDSLIYQGNRVIRKKVDLGKFG